MKTSARKFPCLLVATMLIAAAARGGTVIDLLADPNGWSTWVQRPEVAPKFDLQKPATSASVFSPGTHHRITRKVDPE